MSTVLTTPRADTKAHQLAEQFERQATEHERMAGECADPFEAAAHQGLAQDLRDRAQQALSQTEAARRAAEAQRQRDESAAAARARATETAGAYRDACAAYIDAEQECVAAVQRAAVDLVERADEVTRARAAAEQAARDAGLSAPDDMIEAHLRGLMNTPGVTPERAGLIHAARVSPALLAPRLGLVAGQLADARGGRR